MNEEDESKSALQRLIICFKHAWQWQQFWKGWWHEAKGLPLLLWLGAVSVVAALWQIVAIILFPLTRLLIDPVKLWLKIDSKLAANLEKIRSRQR